ncbi:unnamed protein product, partial [marine sediment metagenome]
MIKKAAKQLDKLDKKGLSSYLSSDLSSQTKRTREQAKKKKLIEATLLELDKAGDPTTILTTGEARILAGFPDISPPWSIAWYRHRRYLVKVLYSLSIPELERWKVLRSLYLMSDIALQERQGTSTKIADA